MHDNDGYWHVEISAGRDINPGDTLMEERPLFSLAAPNNRKLDPYDRDIRLTQDIVETKSAKRQAEIDNRKHHADQEIAAMNPNAWIIFNSLALGGLDTGFENINRLLANTFQTEGPAQQHAQVGHPAPDCYRLFENISRINHSCRPNAVFDWDNARFVGTVRALKTLSPGDEVTLNYIDAKNSIKTKDERLAAIAAWYGFDCACELCSKAAVASNKHRAELMELYQYLTIDRCHDKGGTNCKSIAASSFPTQKAHRYCELLEREKIVDDRLMWG